MADRTEVGDSTLKLLALPDDRREIGYLLIDDMLAKFIPCLKHLGLVLELARISFPFVEYNCDLPLSESGLEFQHIPMKPQPMPKPSFNTAPSLTLVD